MAWLVLVFAGLLEVAWAAALNASDGLSRPLPSALAIVLMVASFWLLGVAMRSIPLGTAYVVWTGIGAVGAVIVGILAFGEPATLPRLGCALLVVLGVVGLKLTGGQS